MIEIENCYRDRRVPVKKELCVLDTACKLIMATHLRTNDSIKMAMRGYKNIHPDAKGEMTWQKIFNFVGYELAHTNKLGRILTYLRIV